MYCDLWSQYIQVWKLYTGGNYLRKYGRYTWTGISEESIRAFARTILLTFTMTIACGSRITLNYNQIDKIIKTWFLNNKKKIFLNLKRILNLWTCLFVIKVSLQTTVWILISRFFIPFFITHQVTKVLLVV